MRRLLLFLTAIFRRHDFMDQETRLDKNMMPVVRVRCDRCGYRSWWFYVCDREAFSEVYNTTGCVGYMRVDPGALACDHQERES